MSRDHLDTLLISCFSSFYEQHKICVCSLVATLFSCWVSEKPSFCAYLFSLSVHNNCSYCDDVYLTCSCMLFSPCMSRALPISPWHALLFLVASCFSSFYDQHETQHVSALWLQSLVALLFCWVSEYHLGLASCLNFSFPFRQNSLKGHKETQDHTTI